MFKLYSRMKLIICFYGLCELRFYLNIDSGNIVIIKIKICFVGVWWFLVEVKKVLFY